MSDMTNVTLRDYIDNRLAEGKERDRERVRTLEDKIISLEKLLDSRMASMQVAITKQEEAYNIRFENVNEFRQSLEDQSKNLVTQASYQPYKDQVSTVFKAHNERISKLEHWHSGIDGKIIGWSSGVGFIVLIISVVLVFVK